MKLWNQKVAWSLPGAGQWRKRGDGGQRGLTFSYECVTGNLCMAW